MKLFSYSIAFTIQLFVVFSVYGATSVTTGEKTLTFEQAVLRGTNLKGCLKKFIRKIDSAYLVDKTGNPNPGLTGKPIFIVLAADEADSSPIIGPLANIPTAEQLATLKGKRICNTPDE